MSQATTEQTSTAPKATSSLDPRRFEARLVERMRAGEEEAYEVLVRQFGGRLLAVARRILPAEDDARDALQEAYIQAFRAIDRFRGDCGLGTWLHRIVVNAALLKLRSKKRRREVDLEALLPAFDEGGRRLEPQAPEQEAGVDTLCREETRAQVRERIAQLPAAYREVILLRDLEGLDTAAAAKVLGITSNAVKIRLHRARLALAELMRGGCTE